MAEPWKNLLNRDLLLGFGRMVRVAYGAFQVEAFADDVVDDTWEGLELKDRTRRIGQKLGDYLPPNYEDALEILFAIRDDLLGEPYWFLPEFVVAHGQADHHWDLSMRALARFTEVSSSELAIRTFLLRDPVRGMEQMTIWAKDADEHLRRLASEGCRPRLPWGESLPVFKKDPTPVLALLELLKTDPSLYVRRSVANNLNDIAKDNPHLVIDTARRWLGDNPNTDWIVRHGCRTLIRKADPQVQALFDYAIEDTLTVKASISADPSSLAIGASSELTYTVEIRPGEPVRVRIEYGVDFIKANGKPSRKLFLLSDKVVPGGAVLSSKRTHHWADLSTRRHYPGAHNIALVLNGQDVASTLIQLSPVPIGPINEPARAEILL
ncbi:MAG: hypothetical protein LBE83_10670 [Propionibacteriaceae bacterium]|jgi:3-methyladenine DNA glycosylase AlkC|nr:hypothetical protein [Propionibacteriaceae bacterium]